MLDFIVVVIASVLVGFLWLFLLYRLKYLREYDMDLLKRIRNKCIQNIYNGKDFMYLYDEFDKISFTKVTLSFWKPVESFYRDVEKMLKE
jgi:hypothetical protein